MVALDGDVAANGDRPLAQQLLKLVGRATETLLVPGADRDAGALLGAPQRSGEADPGAGRTGHEDRSSL